MVSAKSNVPHFYLTVDCEIDELLKLREMMNEEDPSGMLGYQLTTLLLKLAVAL